MAAAAARCAPRWPHAPAHTAPDRGRAVAGARDTDKPQSTAGRGAFLARNLNSRATVAKAVVGVVEKWPDMEGAAKNSSITWVLLLDDVTMFNDGAAT